MKLNDTVKKRVIKRRRVLQLWVSVSNTLNLMVFYWGGWPQQNAHVHSAVHISTPVGRDATPGLRHAAVVPGAGGEEKPRVMKHASPRLNRSVRSTDNDKSIFQSYSDSRHKCHRNRGVSSCSFRHTPDLKRNGLAACWHVNKIFVSPQF